MQVVGFVLFAGTRIIGSCFLIAKITSATKHAKKKAHSNSFTYSFKAFVTFGRAKTFQHKPSVSDDAVPAEHAGNDDDDDDDDDDGLLERRWRETTGATLITLCVSVIVCPHFLCILC